MIVSSIPILAVDLIGSVMMILLALLCLRLSLRLKRGEPDNVIYTYLLWLCLGLVGFAVSRSAGHILRQALVLSGHADVWRSISPYSGAFNSIAFVFVGAVTLFFETNWKTYQKMASDKQALETAHRDLMYINQNLEDLVVERSAALARSEHRYRRIFEISRDGILVTSPEGRIWDINPLGLAILGAGQEKTAVVGSQFQAYFTESQAWQDIMASIDNAGFVASKEVILQHRDGSHWHALISGSLDRSIGGQEASIHFLVKDIEQLRQMEKQMAQTDKLASIGELSAGIAHEINNPLGIILGYTQLLLRKETEASERQQDLKVIEKHVRSCKSIVEDLLNFARSSKPLMETADLNELIADVLQFITQHAQMEGIHVKTAYDQELPGLHIDEKKIRQVMINLLMNSFYAVGNKGRIKIHTRWRQSAATAYIDVQDNGCGIEPRHLARIFDPFYTTKPTGQGTGLGLSVSYGIIKSHGGEISVASTPNQQTTFTVSLPQAQGGKRIGS
jgi:PAS domain S-box-containing protein